MIDETLTVACTRCDRAIKARPKIDGTPKVPKGWRQIGDTLLCRDCKTALYYVRAVRLQIRGVCEHDKDGRTWDDCRKALSAAAVASARLGNWLVQRLFEADQAAAPTLEKTKDGKTKLAPCPTVAYCAIPKSEFSELSGATISALMQQVAGWYKSRRFAALVALNRSVENYRFGFLPVELRAADISLAVDAEGKYMLRGVAIQPGKSWPLKIYADARGAATLRAIQSGEAQMLGAKIVRRAKPGPNGKRSKAWFLRLACLLPRKPARKSHQEITLTLGHDADALLFGSLVAKDDVFEFPGVAARKIIVGGDKTDRRTQQENSLQRGLWSRRKQARWAKDRSLQSAARQRKIGEQIKLCAAALARWCVSHGVTSIDYQVEDRGFSSHFPYRRLLDAIRNATEPHGIAIHPIGQAANDDETEALAGPGSETSDGPCGPATSAQARGRQTAESGT